MEAISLLLLMGTWGSHGEGDLHGVNSPLPPPVQMTAQETPAGPPGGVTDAKICVLRLFKGRAFVKDQTSGPVAWALTISKEHTDIIQGQVTNWENICNVANKEFLQMNETNVSLKGQDRSRQFT